MNMPITWLDIILIAVMLISALLAMIRGFMREVLSIAAWVIAAGVTLYSYTKLLPFAKTYFNNDIVAVAVVVAGTFIATLLVVSMRSEPASAPVWDTAALAPASERPILKAIIGLPAPRALSAAARNFAG